MPGGRPSKLNAETRKKITDAIRMGASYKIAAAYAGVSYDALNDWMNRGQEATSGQYFQFCQAVKEAQGAGAVAWLAKIEKAATDGAWQAAAWKLERIFPDDYALTQKHRIGGDADAPPIRTENRTFTIKIDRRQGDGDDADDGDPGGI
jgi:hypothetical protein